MKHILFLMLVVITLFYSGCTNQKTTPTAGLPVYVPESKELHDSIVRMDSLFFDSYNNCKLDVFESFISEDLEFYHDRGGLSTSKPGLVEAIKNNICGKVTRELLAGSIEVYPIPNYGAIELGVHRFHNNQEKDKGPSRFSKFVQIWHNENGKWKLSRVVSLH
ncbi:MAG: nuclear transport factor 2 family protein [Flavisolibacter sp.]